MQTQTGKQDLNYLLYRQQVERLRAGSAGSDQARDAHLELAMRYETEIRRVAGEDFEIVSPPSGEE
jgi:hypothetical protein